MGKREMGVGGGVFGKRELEMFGLHLRPLGSEAWWRDGGGGGGFWLGCQLDW